MVAQWFFLIMSAYLSVAVSPIHRKKRTTLEAKLLVFLIAL
jgi:hypothetical protein